MIAWPFLGNHVLALFLLWTVVLIPGLTLVALLRIKVGVMAAPLLGVVYWSLALYLLPFSGGLTWAGTLALLAAALVWRQQRQFVRILPILKCTTTWLLLLGSLPYTSTLWFHYVPTGMDASMHTTAAALIAQNRGLPTTFAPFLPDVPFPAVNIGLSAVAAGAIHLGGEPGAVMLAAHHLTFTCLILATYLLARWWTTRLPAALFAVVSVWLARATQTTVDWGGFPTVLSVAVGVLAARLLLHHSRWWNWRLSLATGATIAALPMIHGVGAGTWSYCAGIWTVLATLGLSHAPRRTLASLTLAGLWAAGFLLIYSRSGFLEVGAPEMIQTRGFVAQFAPAADGWKVLQAALDFDRKDSGSLLVLAGWGSCLFLVWRRSWAALFLLGGALLSVVLVIANGRWYILPGSFLLYPERVIFWNGPLCAVGLALAWQGLPSTLRAVSCWGIAAFGLLVLSFSYHNNFYQRNVRERFVSRDGWDALVWAREHLLPECHFVQAAYGSAGSYLPAIAQIGCDGSHYHHFIQRHILQAFSKRRHTHLWIEHRAGEEEILPAGSVVYCNPTVTILELP